MPTFKVLLDEMTAFLNKWLDIGGDINVTVMYYNKHVS